MNIKFHEAEKSIEIKDGLKTQYWFLNVSAIFNIICSIIFPLYILEKTNLEWFGFIWIIIGIFSITLLAYQILKKTASEKLNISEISSLTEKQVLGQKRFSLKLKNGKWRDLITMKKESDIIEMKKLFENIGIEIN